MTEPELDAFLAVVRLGSITAAAQALYITQPALSRRIRTLEAELGYPLLLRAKGVRAVELTQQGRAFLAVADQWKALWGQAREIRTVERDSQLNLACINSVSTYILPQVFHLFLKENSHYRLRFCNVPSLEAYGYVESGQMDLALISDDRYSRAVETIPLFHEKMVLISGGGAARPGRVHPSQLDPAQQVRLPWNPEYDLWHDFWFGAAAQPRVFLDQMALMESFLTQEQVWAVVPVSAAAAVCQRSDLAVSWLEDGPPDRIIYYLTGKRKKAEIVEAFLRVLRVELGQMEGIELY